jgi:predicted DNA-binding transcriptional regulator AlpA
MFGNMGLLMQTFITHSSYKDTAKILDNKRLGKQRVEAYQILRSLSGITYMKDGPTNGWSNHPATKMWKDFEYSLAEYGLEICSEWISRGFRDSLYEKFSDAMDLLPRAPQPWWVSSKLLQKTHQSNLLRKDFSFYSVHFSGVDDLPYVWPLPEKDTYCLGTLTERNINNMTMINGKIYLTSTQVAEICGVSKGTISAYKARGQMPPPDKEFGRTPMWSYDTIQAWRGELGGLPKHDFTQIDKSIRTEGER